MWAYSSVVEHFVDIEGVGSSTLSTPTIFRFFPKHSYPRKAHRSAGIYTRAKCARGSVSRVLFPFPCGKVRQLFILAAHCCVARATNPGSGSRQPVTPPLFGFAPDGVYRAASVASCAVRSYRTLSPLPAQYPCECAQAVCSLLHCPWGCPRRPLTGILVMWSPDFPRARPKARPQLPDPLARLP